MACLVRTLSPEEDICLPQLLLWSCLPGVITAAVVSLLGFHYGQRIPDTLLWLLKRNTLTIVPNLRWEMIKFFLERKKSSRYLVLPSFCFTNFLA
jgi:hypothetical protein